MEEKLRELLNNSYTPYYKYPVASVVVMKDGKEFYGVNVETSSPAAGICAERNAIYSAITSGYGKGTLVELFKQMVGAKLVIVPKGFTLSAILEGHFTDTDGKWLTGLDKGNAANDKAIPFIQECVNLLKMSPNGDYDDDEDFQSEYDPFDHQDLNLHKR